MIIGFTLILVIDLLWRSLAYLKACLTLSSTTKMLIQQDIAQQIINLNIQNTSGALAPDTSLDHRQQFKPETSLSPERIARQIVPTKNDYSSR